MKFPSIDDVLRALVGVQNQLGDDEECDVRLQVYEDGDWAIRWGLSDYDQDHRGYWGAGCIMKSWGRNALQGVAEMLIEQAVDDEGSL